MAFELNKRYIVKATFSQYSTLQEVIVLEISSSGKYIKFKHESAAKVWHDISEYVIIEELKRGKK